MGKIKAIREKDIGAIGIGAMIVFIAMVLVAGIAASVLIQTSARLETQAMATGAETTAEVATGINVVDIEGYATSGSDMEYFAVVVAPRAGSEEIDLDTAFIEICDTYEKLVLSFTTTSFKLETEIDGNLFTTAWYDALSAAEFGVAVLEDADGSCTSTNPIINRGDKVALMIDAKDASGFNSVAERTDIWGMVVPEEGAPGIISFRTPSSYTDAVMDLQ